MLKKSLLLSAVSITAMGLSSAVFANNFGNSNQDVYVGVQAGYGNTHWNDTNFSNVSGFLPTISSDGNPALDAFTLSQSSKGTGFAGRLFAGYDYNQFLGVETGFTYFPKTDVKQSRQDSILDLIDGSVTNTSSSAKDTFNTYGVDLLGKITVPVVDNFGLYAKAGPGYLRSETPGHNVNNVTLVYGLGAQYSITPQLVADASFLRYNGNHKQDSSKFQPNADLYSVGLAYKFNI